MQARVAAVCAAPARATPKTSPRTFFVNWLPTASRRVAEGISPDSTPAAQIAPRSAAEKWLCNTWRYALSPSAPCKPGKTADAVYPAKNTGTIISEYRGRKIALRLTVSSLRAAYVAAAAAGPTKNPMPVSAIVLAYQSFPFDAVHAPIVKSCGRIAMTCAIMFDGEPKNATGNTTPTVATAAIISASLTMLAQAIPRRPAVKTKSVIAPKASNTARVVSIAPNPAIVSKI